MVSHLHTSSHRWHASMPAMYTHMEMDVRWLQVGISLQLPFAGQTANDWMVTGMYGELGAESLIRRWITLPLPLGGLFYGHRNQGLPGFGSPFYCRWEEVLPWGRWHSSKENFCRGDASPSQWFRWRWTYRLLYHLWASPRWLWPVHGWPGWWVWYLTVYASHDWSSWRANGC